MIFRVINSFNGSLFHFVESTFEFMFQVQIRSGHKEQDHVHITIDHRVDIILTDPGKGEDLSVQTKIRYFLDNDSFLFGNPGKSRFDLGYSHLIQSLCDVDLLITSKRDTGHLFSISEG